MYRKSYIEINEDYLIQNIKLIKDTYKDYKYYFGVVKGNAYGHGEYIVNSMIESGINYLAVSSLEEALSVRKFNNEIPILCFGFIDSEYLEIVHKNNITITIISYEYYNQIKNTPYKIKAHLKLNTGMNRLGLNNKEEIANIINSINDTNIYLEGIYTHFATSGVIDIYWDKQIKKFEELTQNIDLSKIPIIHLYNSLSLVKHKKYKYANGIRLGIIMYGFSANANIHGIKNIIFKIKKYIKLVGKKISPTNINNSLKLKKILSIHSEIINIIDIKKGEFVGYNAVYKAIYDTKIATIPIGHADGITDAFKEVIINNNTYNIVSVCMDYIIIIIDDKVNLHDRVTLINDDLTLSKIALNKNDTVHHLLVSLSNRLPRVYIKDSKKTEIKY